MAKQLRTILLLALCFALAACVPLADSALPTPVPFTAPLFEPELSNDAEFKPAAEPVVSAQRLEPSEPRPEATPKPEPFTIAWMSDTQYYSRSFPETFTVITQWLVDNREEENIVYMGFTGDIVHNGTDREWRRAQDALGLLDGALPYGVLAGNHDVGTRKKDYTAYGELFGEARFEAQPHYGGSYENNRGHYDLIDAGGMELIFVYMGWGVDDAGIDWINAILKQYPDRTAVLMLHEYLSTDGSHSEAGRELFERIVVPNANVKFVLCGHNHGVARREDLIDDDGDGRNDRLVYQLLADYQGEPDGGNGFLRLLRFDPANGRIDVTTYSPLLDEYDCFEGEDSFMLPLS